MISVVKAMKSPCFLNPNPNSSSFMAPPSPCPTAKQSLTARKVCLYPVPSCTSFSGHLPHECMIWVLEKMNCVAEVTCCEPVWAFRLCSVHCKQSSIDS